MGFACAGRRTPDAGRRAVRGLGLSATWRPAQGPPRRAGWGRVAPLGGAGDSGRRRSDGDGDGRWWRPRRGSSRGALSARPGLSGRVGRGDGTGPLHTAGTRRAVGARAVVGGGRDGGGARSRRSAAREHRGRHGPRGRRDVPERSAARSGPSRWCGGEPLAGGRSERDPARYVITGRGRGRDRGRGRRGAGGATCETGRSRSGRRPCGWPFAGPSGPSWRGPSPGPGPRTP